MKNDNLINLLKSLIKMMEDSKLEETSESIKTYLRGRKDAYKLILKYVKETK